jgi:thiol-disulfide isomerase/thioredoxin
MRSRFAVLLAFFVLVGSDALLLVRNHELRSALQQLTNAQVEAAEIPTGSTAPPFEATDLAGSHVTIDASSDHPTLLFVFSPTCPYCEQIWPSWRRVIQNLRTTDISVVAVDWTGTVTAQYLKEHVPTEVTVAARPQIDTVVSYRLRVTPQMILIQHGTISAVWSGVDSIQSEITKRGWLTD